MFGTIITQNEKYIYANSKIFELITDESRPLDFILSRIYQEDITDDIFTSGNKFRFKYSETETFTLISSQTLFSSYVVTELRYDTDYIDKLYLLNKSNHDIKQPISGIIGVISLLDTVKMNPEEKEYIHLLTDASLELVTIINDVSDFIKICNGTLVVKPEPMDLQHCLAKVNDISLPKMTSNDVTFKYYIKSDIPRIICDESRLQQVIVYILNILVKNITSGSISMYTSIETINRTEFVYFKILFDNCASDLAYVNTIKTQIRVKAYSVKIMDILCLSIANDIITMMNGIDVKYEQSCVSFGIRYKPVSCLKSIKATRKRIFVLSSNVNFRIQVPLELKKFETEVSVYSDLEELLFFTRKECFNLGIIDVIDNKKLRDRLKNSIPVVSSTPCHKKLPIVVVKQEKDFITNDSCILLTLPKITDVISVCRGLLNEETVEKAKLNILLAEDILVNQQIMTNFLRLLGHDNITIANDGNQCIKHLTTGVYEIAFIDIHMPYISGDEIVDMAVSKKLKTRCSYFVAMVLPNTQFDLPKSKGFSDFITKPIHINDLKICFENYFKAVSRQF